MGSWTERCAAVAVAGLAIALVFVLTTRVGLTSDEGHYLNSGRLIASEGWEHEYTRLHGPLPLFCNQLFLPDIGSGSWQSQPEAYDILVRGRRGMLVFFALGLAVAFAWARRLFGPGRGLLAVLLLGLHPLWLGYGALLTVDVAHSACVLLVLFVLWQFLERPRLTATAGLGVALGLAFATKFLALFNGPVVALTAAGGLWFALRRTGASHGRAAAAGLAGLLVVTLFALVTLHACYGFRVGFPSAEPLAYQSDLVRGLVDAPGVGQLLRCLPEPYLQGVDFQKMMGEREWNTYLNGSYATGHPDYYVRAFLTKSPELFVLAFLLGLVALGREVFVRKSASARRFALVVLPPFVVYGGYLSLLTSLQIGIRYVLPLIGLAGVIAAGLPLPRPFGRARIPAPVLLGTLLLLVSGVDLARNWPNLIAYFSPTAGGQARAYEHFNDSNCDFGQLLGPGRRVLAARESEPFEFLSVHSGPRFGRVAIYVRDLCSEDPERPGFARHWLDPFEPSAHVGAAWYLFDVQREAFRSAARGDERRTAEYVVACLGADARDEARELLAELTGADAEELANLLAQSEVVGTLAPGTAERRALARSWMNVGRQDRALALLEGADAETVHLRAQCLVREQRRPEAIATLEAARGGASKLAPRGRLLLAQLYRQAKRFDEALDLLSELAGELGARSAASAEALRATIELERETFESYHDGLR